MDNKSTTTGSQGGPKIVHEALDERQHIRTKIPAKVTITREDNQEFITETDIEDVSLGGISFKHYGEIPKGTLLHSLISLPMNALEIRIEVTLKVVSRTNHKYGCQFIDLDAGKCDILRYLIVAYTSGEVVDISGLFNIMQRESYIKSRKTKDATQRNIVERLKAIIGTSLFAIAGLLALSFVLYKSYLLFFTLTPTEAVVSADTYTISMPDNGYLKLLLKPNQTSVVDGEPLVNISTQLATHFTNPSDMQMLDKLTSEETSQLLAKTTVETVINSPCDCEVFYPYPIPKGFSYKESPLLYLVPKNEKLYVKATIPYGKLNNLNRISRITINVYNSTETIEGKIFRTQIDNRTQSTILFIEPNKPLPKESYQQPVSVNLFLGLPFSF